MKISKVDVSNITEKEMFDSIVGNESVDAFSLLCDIEAILGKSGYKKVLEKVFILNNFFDCNGKLLHVGDNVVWHDPEGTCDGERYSVYEMGGDIVKCSSEEGGELECNDWELEIVEG